MKVVVAIGIVVNDNRAVGVVVGDGDDDVVVEVGAVVAVVAVVVKVVDAVVDKVVVADPAAR